MKTRILKYAPPGYDANKLWILYCWLYVLAVVISFYLPVKIFIDQWTLYFGNGVNIIPGRMMPDFVDLIDYAFVGFFILTALSLSYIYIFYSYFNGDSKSIYLMKRLPSRHELMLRCVIMPAAGALFSLAGAVILLMVYFGIYMLTTPDECLAPDQFEKLWRCVLC